MTASTSPSRCIDQLTTQQVKVLQGLLLARGFGEVRRLVGSDGRPDGIAGVGTKAALEESRVAFACGGAEGTVDPNLLVSLQASPVVA